MSQRQGNSLYASKDGTRNGRDGLKELSENLRKTETFQHALFEWVYAIKLPNRQVYNASSPSS